MTSFTVNAPPSTSMAFTLSELLVGLAILGLVAAMAVPALISSINEQQLKALSRDVGSELMSLVYTLTLDGRLKVSTPGSEYRTLLDEHLHYTRFCAHPYNDGCTTLQRSQANGYHWWGWETAPMYVLHNGAFVQYLDPGYNVWCNNNKPCSFFLVDLNGDKGPNQTYKDIYTMAISLPDPADPSYQAGRIVGGSPLLNP
jgi:prepilin-type N-terminal cleavage/methylation domain-containing protein